MAVVLKPNQAGLSKVLRNKTGPVGIYMAENGKTVVKAAQGIAPVVTGRYKKAFASRVEQRPAGLTTIVSNYAPYSLFVEEDTRPHVIRPRKAKVLRFASKGVIVFAKSVNHPGTRGQHVLRRALNSIRQ